MVPVGSTAVREAIEKDQPLLELPGRIHFFNTVPRERLEAGAIDGAGYLRTLLTIIMPLATPALVTLGIVILCVPHAFSTGILVAASLHLAAGMPHGRLTEFTVSDSPFARELLAEPFRLEPDGTVRVPQTPGLGVALNEEVLRRYAEVPILDVPGRQV